MYTITYFIITIPYRSPTQFIDICTTENRYSLNKILVDSFELAIINKTVIHVLTRFWVIEKLSQRHSTMIATLL
jgi:archaellum biogenesis ATPase FlaH